MTRPLCRFGVLARFVRLIFIHALQEWAKERMIKFVAAASCSGQQSFPEWRQGVDASLEEELTRTLQSLTA